MSAAETKEINEIKDILMGHIERSNKDGRDIKESIAALNTHLIYTKEELMSHKKALEELKTAHNKQKGAVWVLGIIGLGWLAEFAKNIIIK